MLSRDCTDHVEKLRGAALGCLWDLVECIVGLHLRKSIARHVGNRVLQLRKRWRLLQAVLFY
jgi:hypothetical protein